MIFVLWNTHALQYAGAMQKFIFSYNFFYTKFQQLVQVIKMEERMPLLILENIAEISILLFKICAKVSLAK